MKRLLIILAMAGIGIQTLEQNAHAGNYAIGQKIFHDESGRPYGDHYYVYTGDKCNPYQKYNVNALAHDKGDAVVINQTWINQGATAETGNSVFSLGTYDPNNLKQPNHAAALISLSGKLSDGAVKIAGDAKALAELEQSDFTSAIVEALQVEKLKGLATVAAATKADPASRVQLKASASVGGNTSRAEASSGDGHEEQSAVALGLDAELTAMDTKCQTCHGGEAKSGAGVSLPSIAAMDPGTAETAWDYIKQADGCTVKAKLSDDQQSRLLKYLGKKF